ncbi:MraY family glycosyltransferase [Mesorhizobium xinjiangense]|uniref:glycoside hydrolase n=1 Tax=Mesorhizobium xinjiangense TaxID=2678685 RepID=UPI0012EE60E7|nr:glycoside hydrolase [Mesorhizobium xinjiangense]
MSAIAILLILVIAMAASAALLALLARILPPDFLAAGINSRSNHTQPARQIGGLAVMPAALAAMALSLVWVTEPGPIMAAMAGTALLLAVGYADDRWHLSVGPRLLCQVAAAILFVVMLGPEARIFPGVLPLVVERAIAAFVLVWFINLTNFMDGLDLMVVAGIGVPHAVLAILGMLSLIDTTTAAIAAALAGAVIGFAPRNRPPAGTFLGDSGSLGAGYLTGIVVILLACANPLAALLPFLFFLADSTSVLLLRLARRENVLQAHSAHAYQLARRSGRSVYWVTSRVALLSLCLGALAAIALARGNPIVNLIAVAAGLGATALLIVVMRGATRERQARTGVK